MSNIFGRLYQTFDLPKIYYLHVENLHIYERINFKNNLGNMYVPHKNTV